MTVIEMPLGGFAPDNASIAAHLRAQADYIESEDRVMRNCFVVWEWEDGGIDRQTCGQPCDWARAIGILHLAAFRTTGT